MSFQSKASKITTENYVEIKQEAYANLPKTTKLSANNPNFGPFEPKNTSFMPLNPTNIRPNSSLSSSGVDKGSNTTTLKGSINPSTRPSDGSVKGSMLKTFKSSTHTNDPSITSNTTTLKGSINPSTKPSYGSFKSFMFKTFKSSTPTNVPSIISKTTTLKGSINPSTKPSTPTNVPSIISKTTTLKGSINPSTKPSTPTNVPSIISRTTALKVSINPSTKPSTPTNFPCSEVHVDTHILGEGGPTDEVWKPGGKIQWTENIDVDLNEVIQVEDIKENEPPKIGIMEGTIVAKHVWCLPPGRRIIVHFNEYDQPVRKGGLVLIHFLSDLSKDGSFCPIRAQTWRHVDSHYKEKIIKTAYDKFVLPDWREIR